MTLPVAGSRPGCSGCFTTGGTSSSVSPSPTSTARRSPAARPLFLTAIATRTRHARQTTIRVTSSHARAEPAAKALAAVAAFRGSLAKNAGAVDPPAKMASDPVARLPGVPRRTSPQGPAPPRAKLMQPSREKSAAVETSDRSNAVFRLISPIFCRPLSHPAPGASDGASRRAHACARLGRRRTDSLAPRQSQALTGNFKLPKRRREAGCSVSKSF